jgi:tetratricopeptide (TPR) repeat protein
LQQALSIENNFTDALSALALHYYAAGKSAKAQEAFDRLALIQPDYPNVYYNLGVVLNARMHYSRAIEMYQKALQQESNDPDVWNNMGIVYYQMGMYGEAKDSFNRAVEIEPNQTTARANLEKLERRLQRGLTEQPVRPSAKLKEYIETGAALYASGDYSKALEYFSKALQLQPDDFKANNNIALTYMKMGDIDSAKKHFQRALNRCDREPCLSGNTEAGKTGPGAGDRTRPAFQPFRGPARRRQSASFSAIILRGRKGLHAGARTDSR